MPLVSLMSKLFTHSSCGNSVFAAPELSPDWTLYSTRAAISRSPAHQCTQAECAHRTGLFQLQPLSHHSTATPTSCEGRSSSRLLNCFLNLLLHSMLLSLLSSSSTLSIKPSSSDMTSLLSIIDSRRKGLLTKTGRSSNYTETNESPQLFIRIACIFDNFMLQTVQTSQGEGSGTATAGYFHFYIGKQQDLGQIIFFCK